jgi:hypothetical protein
VAFLTDQGLLMKKFDRFLFFSIISVSLSFSLSLGLTFSQCSVSQAGIDITSQDERICFEMSDSADWGHFLLPWRTGISRSQVVHCLSSSQTPGSRHHFK